MCWSGHVMRGSSGFNAFLVLEGNLMGREQEADIIGDIIQWMQKKKYDEVKRLAENKYTRRKMTRHLLTQKMALGDERTVMLIFP